MRLHFTDVQELMMRSTMGVGRPAATSREAVRTVALELFRAQGYSQTSLQAIADQAGISRTTLFSYFPSKHELVWGEGPESITRMRESLDRHRQWTSTPEALVAALDETLSFGASERRTVRERWRIVDADPDLRTIASNYVEALTLVIAEFLSSRPRHASKTSDGSDGLIVATALHAAATVAARLWAREGGEETGSLAEAIAAVVAPILAAFGFDPPERRAA